MRRLRFARCSGVSWGLGFLFFFLTAGSFRGLSFFFEEGGLPFGFCPRAAGEPPPGGKRFVPVAAGRPGGYAGPFPDAFPAHPFLGNPADGLGLPGPAAWQKKPEADGSAPEREDRQTGKQPVVFVSLLFPFDSSDRNNQSYTLFRPICRLLSSKSRCSVYEMRVMFAPNACSIPSRDSYPRSM